MRNFIMHAYNYSVWMLLIIDVINEADFTSLR